MTRSRRRLAIAIAIVSLGVIAAAAAFLFLSPASVSSFDTLAAMLARIPVEDVGEERRAEFYFMSPRQVTAWPAGDVPGVGAIATDMGAALLDRQIGVESAGIPFADLDGILVFGTPPQQLFLLAGDVISVNAVGEALLRRPNMERTQRDGITVFAEGEDRATDITARDPDYPFGGGWRAHRVAVWDGGVAVAFDWAVLDPLLPAVAQEAFEPTGGGALLAAMVEAARDAAPGSAEAVAASGLPGVLLSASEEQLAGVSEDRLIPPFRYVLFVASAGSAGEAAQAVLAYDNRGDAEAGAAALAANLSDADFREAGSKVQTQIVEATGAFLAVVSVMFGPNAEGHPGTAELNRWQQDVFALRLELFAVGSQ